jgi:DNA helicase-2/ATP-dependent DNA helicase PcrA
MQDTITIQKYLESLNEAQIRAVENLEGPQLVLAGAGTGKTKVLTSRIAHIILSGKAYPSQILSVTFTNKAAKEMLHRVSGLVNSEGIWLGTFHSIAAKILRKHAELVGLSSNYNIVDGEEQIKLVKSILISLHIDDKKYPPKLISGHIQRWKDLCLTIDKIAINDIVNDVMSVAYKVYQQYQPRLLVIGSVDFADLLLYNIELFTKHTDILNYYHNKFKYILVDEYQDTNISQYIWLKMLAQKNKNICCVGDEDQSIYGWRGAEIGNILRFEQDFPNAKITKLEQNYRSSNHILSVATRVISHNKMRLGKELWTDISGGSKVKLVSCEDDRGESRFVAQEILTLKRNEDIKLSDVAILVRAGFQTRAFEECFMSYGINYRVIGGLKFYDRMEVKDVIAYIRVAIRFDDDLALERIINVPKRAIGDATVKELKQYGELQKLSLFRSIEKLAANNGLKTRVRSNLTKLIEQFHRWHDLFETHHHIKVIEMILQESGYFEMWKMDKSPEAETRIENIREILRALGEFNNITEFLHHVTLVTDIDQKDSGNLVSIMTLHAAKGLEFDNIFLPGWEEGIFPHQRSLSELGTAALEEERRLAYVGITRAKKNLYISHVDYRRIYNQIQTQRPSRFIEELPENNIELVIWT